jgi:hypothetical protein
MGMFEGRSLQLLAKSNSLLLDKRYYILNLVCATLPTDISRVKRRTLIMDLVHVISGLKGPNVIFHKVHEHQKGAFV